MRLLQAFVLCVILFGSLTGCNPSGYSPRGNLTATPDILVATDAAKSTQAARAPDSPSTSFELAYPAATVVPTVSAESVNTQSATRQPTYTARPTPTLDPAAWKDLPVIPEISPRALEILRDGLAKGNNPHAFSKIGDCESQASWFLGEYDLPNGNYALGSYETQLAPVIDYYSGSFKRVSLAARPGFTAASLMAPIWADKQQCQKDETPLACEYRLQRPLVAFILLGSNDASNPKTFEGHMRRVIEFSIKQGVLPILGTKADNVEGDHRLNSTMARLAYEYDLPLWNYWAAVQALPDHGLQDDGVHLTFAAPHFDDPFAMKKAWPVRNLNALLILETLMKDTKSINP